jgi:hypothetical protein
VEEFGVMAILEQKAHSPVEFTVTACHAMRGSGSSKINIDKKDTLPVEEFGVTAFHQNRGEIKVFQHLYKSTKIMSSLRVLAAHKGTIKHGGPWNFFSKRRGRKKRAKISSLPVVEPSPKHAIHMDQENNPKPIFISGMLKRNVPNQFQIALCTLP